VAADRILLVVLEDRGVRRLLPLEDDVEDRVKPALSRQDAAELALGDADRVRLLAAAVEDAGDEALTAQAPSVGRATVLALLHLQLDSFAGHFGGPWYLAFSGAALTAGARTSRNAGDYFLMCRSIPSRTSGQRKIAKIAETTPRQPCTWVK
jgi:hypothetical protein